MQKVTFWMLLARRSLALALGLALDQENSGIAAFLLSQGASLNPEDYRILEL